MPVGTNATPAALVVAVESAEAVEVDTHATVATPEPAAWPVVLVLPPQMPVAANPLPLTLHIAVEGAEAVLMAADATIPTPAPLLPAVELVVVLVAMDQLPVRTNLLPCATSPALEDAKTVQMATDSAETAPEPAVGLVVVVLLPHVPVAANLLPATVVVAVEGAVAVQVVADAAVPTPAPLSTPMEPVAVVVASVT